MHNEVWLTSCPCGIPASQFQCPAHEPHDVILNHIRETYPNTRDEDSSWATRAPDALIMDIACKIYASRLRQGADPYWAFIAFLVDLFHLENHDHTDHLCRLHCDPRSVKNSWFMKGTS